MLCQAGVLFWGSPVSELQAFINELQNFVQSFEVVIACFLKI